MQWVVISGVGDLDGRYEFDVVSHDLTTREWGWIKRHSGYLPLTVEEGFDGADPELFACFAIIALHRAGKVLPRDVPAAFDRIIDSPFGATVTIESDQPEEVEPGPPVSSSNGSDSISGDASATSSESLGTPPSPTGIPASDSSVSAPARSGT
jgi:hypothetical protein